MSQTKGARVVISLECISCRISSKTGVSRYSTTKNKRNNPEKLEAKKFCKFCNIRTIHKEIK